MTRTRALGRRVVRAWGGWPVHVALAVLLVPRAVFLGETLFDRDLHMDWYPRALVIAQTLRSGLLPLWDLSIGFGQPLLADPGAQVLYPTTWLTLLLAPWTVYTIYTVLHLAFSGVGFTRLARVAGLDRLEAIAAGAAWMLSGPFVSLVNLWHHFAGAAWMPWVVLATHRLVRRPTAGRVVLFAVALAFQVLAGSGDMVLITAAVAVAWLLGTAPPLARSRRALVPLAGGVALAAALSAMQWVPTVELASRAMRRDLPDDWRVQWSVPPAGLVRIVVPLDASGSVAYTDRAHVALFDGLRHPFFASLYLGVPALALAACALGGRRRRLAFTLAATAAGALLIALGPHAPFHGLAVRLVPGASHFRFPTKLTIATAFAVAMLAGLGLRALRRREVAPRAGVAAAAIGALALAGAALLFGPALRTAIEWGLLLDRTAVEGDALPSFLRLLDHAVLAAIAVLAFLQTTSRPGLARVLLAGVLVADLLLAHHDTNATAPPSLLTIVPPVVGAVDRGERGRVYVYEYEILRGVSERHLGRPVPYAVAQPLPGIDPRPLAAFAMRVYPVPPAGGSWGLESSYDLDTRGLQPIPLHELNLLLRRIEGTADHLRLLQVGAVRTVVALHEDGFENLVPGPTFQSLFPERIRTFAVPGALPRVYTVGRARVVPERQGLAAVLAPDLDPEREVVLSGKDAPDVPGASGDGGGGRVAIERLFADRVLVVVERKSPGLLVDVDAWAPGWTASVDGRPTPVLRANGIFRAVAVPAGRHVVELAYRPASVRLGFAVTGLAWALAGAIAVRRRARRRPRAGRAGD